VRKQLYRSRENKMFTGLCGGLGELTNVDATLYRVLLVVLTILSSGIFIVLYFIVSAVVPKTPSLHTPFGHHQRPYGGNPYGGNPYGGTPYGSNPQGYQDPMQQRPTWNQGGPGPGYTQPHGQAPFQSASTSTDQMMDDLEKKALRREIEELKEKNFQVREGRIIR